MSDILVCSFIYLFIQFIYLLIYIFIHLFIYLFIHLSNCLFIYLSIYFFHLLFLLQHRFVLFIILVIFFIFFTILEKKTEQNFSALPSSQALIIGKNDFLSILTSCIVCVMKSDDDLVNHLLTWGFLQAVCVCLKNALDSDRRGEPVTCVIRLLHQFVGTYL